MRMSSFKEFAVIVDIDSFIPEQASIALALISLVDQTWYLVHEV